MATRDVARRFTQRVASVRPNPPFAPWFYAEIHDAQKKISTMPNIRPPTHPSPLRTLRLAARTCARCPGTPPARNPRCS